MGTSGIDANGSDVTVNAGLIQGIGGPAPLTTIKTSAGPICTAQAVDPVTAFGLMNRNPNGDVSVSGDPGQGPGSWYVITCPGTTPSLQFTSALGPQGAQPPLVQPRALAQEALARMHLPAPTVEMSPPSSAGVVNFRDWLWVDPSSWHPISATATAGAVTATATGTPDRVVYEMGDGAEVVCTGPGTPYNPSSAPQDQSTSCSHTYVASSAGQPENRYTTTATIYWSVRWTAVGAAGGGSLGEIAGDTSTSSVTVDEIQAITTVSR
jgi:hypothetical protein